MSRDPVPDVPSVYFCLPNEENLQRIARDLESGLYGKYYFNFISPIPRQKLEDLASLALQSNTVAQVMFPIYRKIAHIFIQIRTSFIYKFVNYFTD